MHNLIPIWGFDQRGKLIDRIEAYLPVKAAENLFVGRYSVTLASRVNLAILYIDLPLHPVRCGEAARLTAGVR